MGQGALRFSHSGHRYILGYGEDFFGIWDRETAGGPVHRFPRSDLGWMEAWTRFFALEPGAATVPRADVAGRDLRISDVTFTEQGSLARWVQALIAVIGALGVLAGALWANRLALIEGQGLEALRTVRAGENAVVAEAVAGLLVIPVGILWLVWQHHAHRNLRSLGISGLRYSPGWAVGWWFVPFANLVMPYLAVRELWRASDPQSGADDHASNPSSPLLGLWWVSWLGWSVLSAVATGAAPATGAAAAQATTEAALSLVADLLLASSAVLAILVVSAVQRRQTERKGPPMDRVPGAG